MCPNRHLMGTSSTNSCWTQWPLQSIPEGCFDFFPTIKTSMEILRTKSQKNSPARCLGGGKDPTYHWHCSFCLAGQVPAAAGGGRGWVQESWNNISSAQRADREGVDIQSDTCPGRVYLHILTGCICNGCYFRLVLSLYIYNGHL